MTALMFRSRRAQPMTKRQEAENLLRTGASVRGTARETGLNPRTVGRIREELIAEGVRLPEKVTVTAPDFMRSLGVRLGVIDHVFHGFTDAQLRHLAREIPHGCTMADWLRGVVVDVLAGDA